MHISVQLEISITIDCNQKEIMLFYLIISTNILIKTKIYFIGLLNLKINSNNCQSIYIDLSSIRKMRKPFSLLSYPKKKVPFLASSTTPPQMPDEISCSSHKQNWNNISGVNVLGFSPTASFFVTLSFFPLF